MAIPFSPRSWFPGAALAAALAVALPLPAQAALPFGSLDFVQRVATVLPDEVIEVRMRLTIDPASPPLLFSSNPLSGFLPEDLPTEGQYYNPDTEEFETRPVASITGAYLNTFFGCDDTFTGGCNGNTSNYRYDFFLTSQPGSPSINFLDSFNLAPGASFEYVFATFTPAAGGAAPGTYLFYRTGVTLNFNAFDAAGNYLSTPSRDIATTCAFGNTPECAFTRIVEVPEPATWGLLGLGLLVVGGAAARRGRAGA